MQNLIVGSKSQNMFDSLPTVFRLYHHPYSRSFVTRANCPIACYVLELFLNTMVEEGRSNTRYFLLARLGLVVHCGQMAFTIL